MVTDGGETTASGAHDVRGQTVLVTGGAGFIGSHLVESLLPDNDVRVIDDLSSGRRDNVPADAELTVGDIRDERQLDRLTDGVDSIFHLAGEIRVEDSIADPLPTHEANVTGTLKLLEAARTESARFVFASSAAVYGTPGSVPIGEDDPTEPTSPYGLSKLSAEQYVRMYARTYDLPTVALRYFNVYGPGQMTADYSAVIGVFLEQARRDAPITVNGEGTQTRDFVHVSDVVRANLLAATTEATGDVFNVGTGESVTVRELAELIRDMLDAESEIVHRDPRPGDIEHSMADISKARAVLGYEPSVPLESGLETLVAETAGDDSDE